jgi:hypothetical protein
MIEIGTAKRESGMRTVSLFGGVNNAVFPTREDVHSLVVSIFGVGTQDKTGRAYVCYYVKTGETSSMSNGLVEDTLDRSVALSRLATSHEIDIAEARLRREVCGG